MISEIRKVFILHTKNNRVAIVQIKHIAAMAHGRQLLGLPLLCHQPGNPARIAELYAEKSYCPRNLDRPYPETSKGFNLLLKFWMSNIFAP